MYVPWASSLPAGVELCAIQLPGRETRRHQTPHSSLPVLVTELADHLEPMLDRPYSFFGHSLGALVSFELTRELRRRGRPLPQRLFLSGRGAPSLGSDSPHLHALPDSAFIAQVCRRYEGFPKEILDEPELVALFMPVLRADFALFETHVHVAEAPLPCPFSIYGGREDPQVAPRHIDAWRALTGGGFDARLFDGGHFYLQDQRAAVLSALAADLTRQPD
jgi:medium-chain acyl-[acyl-carrier-protein] hydrolase